MTTHELKVHSEFWHDVIEGRNRAQVRRADRPYAINDVLILSEYDPSFGYTGASCKRIVTHVLHQEDVPRGIEPGWCVLSIRRFTGG